MRSALIGLLAILILPPVVFAQEVTTGPVTTSNTLAWTAPNNAATLAEAQSLEYRFRDNGGAFLVVPAITCAGAAVPYACQVNLTTAMVSTLNTIGVHNVTLSAYKPGTTGLESAQSIPFVLTYPPAAPTGVRITP